MGRNFPSVGKSYSMEQLETEFGKDNCPSCPLVYHLGTSFILKIAESTRPAVDCMQTLCPNGNKTISYGTVWSIMETLGPIWWHLDICRSKLEGSSNNNFILNQMSATHLSTQRLGSDFSTSISFCRWHCCYCR